MALLTCSGAAMTCSMGLAPATFNATPKVLSTGGKPMGHVRDFVPFLNIAPFGMCQSLANPTVAAATSASGVLTPMPCVPATVAPWAPGVPTVLLAGAPALDQGAKLNCLWAGVIGFSSAGQALVQAG